VTSLLDNDKKFSGGNYVFIIVVENDQLDDYRQAFEGRDVLWLVLPAGAHRGVLVTRQLIHLCIRGMKEKGLIVHELYFQMDDDVKKMEIREYECKPGGNHTYEENELTLQECLDYVMQILSPDSTITILNTRKKNQPVTDFPEFHDKWVEIGCLPSRYLKGSDQYGNMKKFELGPSARVSGFMALHIARSACILFCPLEWLWYGDEQWGELQNRRKQVDTEDAKMIQFIYFQGEDFRACAMTAENLKGKSYIHSYMLKRLVFHFPTNSAKYPSVARTININQQEQEELAEIFNVQG